MKTRFPSAEECREDEIASLIRTLNQTQERLQELAGGELDAIVLPGGQSYLLHDAQQQLVESEERFRRISAQLTKVLDSSQDVICTFDADGRFTQVSAACETVWGYRPEELLGVPFTDLVHPDDLVNSRQTEARILSGEQVKRFTNRYVRKDGSFVDMSWSSWWSEEDQSNFCVAHDITEALQAEVETRELAERLQLAVKASKVGIWDWDLGTDVMHWDDQMFVLYGDPPGSSANLELWQQHLHPDDKPGVERAINEALRPGGPPYEEHFRILLCSTGEVRHIRAQGVVFRDEAGRPTRMLGTNWDVTEEFVREEVLRIKLANESVLLQQALAGQKAKSEFLAVMSHEIRTPMNGVLGCAELLVQSEALMHEDRDLVQIILSSGGSLLRILDDILDLSSIEARRLTIANASFSPRDLLHEVEMHFGRLIQAKGLEFQVSCDEQMPPTLGGDAGRIRQILGNLLGNALKFTEHGLIQLDVRIASRTADGGVLACSVSDTGSGIDPAMIDAVFEPFTQADSSIDRHHGGTGLGLAISRQLAELMGGSLQVKNKEAGGTVFLFLCPVSVDHRKDASDSSRPPATVRMDIGFAAAYPLRILVVDDDKVNLKLGLMLLRRIGYDPMAASDGREAVESYGRERPDCILMDIQMPGMDGIEAARRIRAFESAQALPPAYISALTANLLPENRAQCLEAGMNACLNKPVKSQSIMDALAAAVQFRRSQAPH